VKIFSLLCICCHCQFTYCSVNFTSMETATEFPINGPRHANQRWPLHFQLFQVWRAGWKGWWYRRVITGTTVNRRGRYDTARWWADTRGVKIYWSFCLCPQFFCHCHFLEESQSVDYAINCLPSSLRKVVVNWAVGMGNGSCMTTRMDDSILFTCPINSV